MTHTIARLVAAVALLALPLTAFAWDDCKFSAERKGGVIQVHVQTPENMSGIGVSYAYLDLQVVVPEGLPVEITDSSGDLSVEGVRAVRVEDSSGDMIIERIAGDVTIDRDSSGDVLVSNVGGNVDFRADSSGLVRVTEVKGTVRLP